MGQGRLPAWTTTPLDAALQRSPLCSPRIDYVAVETYNPYTTEKITAIVAEPRLELI